MLLLLTEIDFVAVFVVWWSELGVAVLPVIFPAAGRFLSPLCCRRCVRWVLYHFGKHMSVLERAPCRNTVETLKKRLYYLGDHDQSNFGVEIEHFQCVSP